MSEGRSGQEYEGNWRWDADAARLQIEIRAGSRFADLKGIWSPDGLAKLLDGLSPPRLDESLTGRSVTVNCALTFSDGRQLQMVGAFLGDTDARGMLLSSAAPAEDRGEGPGPALDPAYQPIISLRSGQLAGFEALARWRGEGLAGRFEDDGLASNMLIRAAEALATWQGLTGRGNLFMHVNLTGRDLEHKGLAGLVEALVEGHGLAPGLLRIELTEQAALRDAGDALAAAGRLKAAGAGLVLDDFGSGHSSFAWLASLPADALKIDPELTRRVGEPRHDTVLAAVARLAHELGMTVTAEGVEDAALLEALERLGFDHVQGYALGRPAGRETTDDLLRSGRLA